ncbi:MAG: antibiotic biosynthesis monooxygenase [Candidatus Korobacteraceae bacterium]|jgi:antibiotic biosynthesis monooxygenase (ABM) superfamily enzyme
MNETNISQQLTAVVRRRIKAGSEARFEELMAEFIAFVLRQPGTRGINVIRPAEGSRDYTVLDHFASEADRRRLTSSDEYRVWMQRLREVSEAAPEIQEIGGLAFWFTPPDRPLLSLPSTVKMASVTLLGVYPLTMLFPFIVNPLTPGWPYWLQGVIIAALIVIALTWLVMPALTRLFGRWLFGST